MVSSRLFRAVFVIAVATGAVVVACGGDDGGGGGGGGNADAQKTFMDAKVFMDAAPAMGLGQPCTLSSSNPQGDCPSGYTCLSLNNGTHPWCSKTCMKGSADMCNVGYTGPGVGNCFWGITFGSGSAVPYCGVVCALPQCGSACNGTCPGGLACSVGLTFGSNTMGSG